MRVHVALSSLVALCACSRSEPAPPPSTTAAPPIASTTASTGAGTLFAKPIVTVGELSISVRWLKDPEREKVRAQAAEAVRAAITECAASKKGLARAEVDVWFDLVLTKPPRARVEPPEWPLATCVATSAAAKFDAYGRTEEGWDPRLHEGYVKVPAVISPP